MMDALWHARLRELCNAATPGPWTHASHFGAIFQISAASDAIVTTQFCYASETEANAAFIAAARAAMPALLDEIERMQGLLEADAMILATFDASRAKATARAERAEAALRKFVAAEEELHEFEADRSRNAAYDEARAVLAEVPR